MQTIDRKPRLDARSLDQFFGQVVDEFSSHGELIDWCEYLRANEDWEWFKTKRMNALLRLPTDNGDYRWLEISMPGGETISDNIPIESQDDLEAYLRAH